MHEEIIVNIAAFVFETQLKLWTQIWHNKECQMPKGSSFENLVKRLHYMHFILWHLEDEARSIKASDEIIAQVKRDIDIHNGLRATTARSIDQILHNHLTTLSTYNKDALRDSEGLGSIVDRMCVIMLKIIHMEEALEQDQDLIETYASTLEGLRVQFRFLQKCFMKNVTSMMTGVKSLTFFTDFKLYDNEDLNPVLQREAEK